MSHSEVVPGIVNLSPVSLSASEFRRTVSACLRRAQKDGVATVIMRHRRVVARLVPVHDPRAEALRRLAQIAPSIKLSADLQRE